MNERGPSWLKPKTKTTTTVYFSSSVFWWYHVDINHGNNYIYTMFIVDCWTLIILKLTWTWWSSKVPTSNTHRAVFSAQKEYKRCLSGLNGTGESCQTSLFTEHWTVLKPQIIHILISNIFIFHLLLILSDWHIQWCSYLFIVMEKRTF